MTTELLPVRSRRQTLRKPLKTLDPGRSKLPTVEAQRIISVLDETIFKLELVSAFSHILKNLQEFSSTFGPELTGAFVEHLRLTNIMGTTIARLEREDVLHKGIAIGELFGAEEPSGYLAFHVQGLKSSVRNIVRLFCANPLACHAVKDATDAIPPSSTVFIKGLWELREVLFEKLLTTPLEEKEKNRFMHEIAERDKKNAEMIAALEDELSAAIQNRDEEISKKNAAIKDLKTQLHNLSKFAEEQIQGTRVEGEKQQKAELRASQAKCAKLQQELQQLKAQLDALVAENREFELFLRKKKYKVEIEIENWVQKYDIEMLEKQEEIEEIEVVYAVEKEQLAELREKFALLNQEYSQIMEERRIKQEQKEKAEKELAILSRAATLIQALWKGYLVRSQLRTRRRKKGKGKRGGRK